MKGILVSLEALFLQFNMRRLFFWLFVPILVGVVLLIGESKTGWLFLTRMERKASLLKELYSLSQNGITQNPEFHSIYEDIVAELAAYKVEPFYISQITGLESFWKFLSGASLGLVVALFGLAEREKDPERWKSTVYGGLFLAVIFGFMGPLIPTIYNPWVNYLGYPIFQILVLFALSKLIGTTKSSKVKKST